MNIFRVAQISLRNGRILKVFKLPIYIGDLNTFISVYDPITVVYLILIEIIRTLQYPYVESTCLLNT